MSQWSTICWGNKLNRGICIFTDIVHKMGESWQQICNFELQYFAEHKFVRKYEDSSVRPFNSSLTNWMWLRHISHFYVLHCKVCNTPPGAKLGLCRSTIYSKFLIAHQCKMAKMVWNEKFGFKGAVKGAVNEKFGINCASAEAQFGTGRGITV